MSEASGFRMKQINIDGEPALIACDGNCAHAWGGGE